MARWLADRVGPSGHVVTTDLHIEQMSGLAEPNLEVRVHDIVDDPLDDATYDLVHLRFVLQHLGDHRTSVLNKLVAALRPGGWLLVEDGDWTAFDGSLRDAPADLVRWNARQTRLFREQLGVDVYAGRRLLSDLLATGLVDIGSEGRVIMMGEHAASIEVFAEFIEQAMPALEPHGLSRQQGDAFLRFIRSPSFDGFGLIQMAGWGRRPS